MSMQPNGGERPNPSRERWTAAAIAAGTVVVLVLGMTALDAVKANGGSITATSSYGEIAVSVLAPQ